MPTFNELKTDIINLYERGESRPLRALPERGEVTLEDLRAALRLAFTDAQIDARDYRAPKPDPKADVAALAVALCRFLKDF